MLSARKEYIVSNAKRCLYTSCAILVLLVAVIALGTALGSF